MYQVENPMVLDLPERHLPDYDSVAYWWNHADDGSDAQDETVQCDLRERLEEEKQRRIARGEWDAICEEHFQWLIKH